MISAGNLAANRDEITAADERAPTGDVPQKLRVLDIFSGIGGFSLGLERTGGFETVAFCEIDPFCRRVLAKHWPNVRQFNDVTKLRGEDVGPVDVICGGFPCQDISTAGKGAGLAGKRSGLWSEYARLIGELRPAVVIVENVAALLGRGLGRVLGDLAALGYDAEWHCIPAAAVGAPHIRDRVWIVAKPQHPDADGAGSYRADGNLRAAEPADEQCCQSESLGAVLADADMPEGKRQQQHDRQVLSDKEPVRPGRRRAGERARQSIFTGREMAGAFDASRGHDGCWGAEPDVGRVAHGVSARVDRLRALGNAVVPQIPELIGRAILEARAAA